MARLGAESIRDDESFQAWLESWPPSKRREVDLVIASRTAMRVIPAIYKPRLYPSLFFKVLQVFVFRQNIVLRSKCSILDHAIESAAVDAAVNASSAHDAADRFELSYRSSPHSSEAGEVADAFRYVEADFDSTLSIARNAVFATADAFAAVADIWVHIGKDATSIDDGMPIIELYEEPLWRHEPEWLAKSYLEFEEKLHSEIDAKDNWPIWLEWYEPIAQGHPAFNLKNRQTAEALERNIALGGTDGEFHEEFWNREPREINHDIAQWVAEARAAEMEGKRNAKPIFISYTAKNLESVMRIGAIVEDGGYPVFAQYKDMPPGSNFVAMMQRGLTGMGKFVPIYSPDYVLSDHCNAEWNAAYNMDPLGEKRLIVGFMLHKAELLPLQQQTVYVPLVGLTEMQAREVILSTLQRAGAKMTAVESRKAAFEKAIPIADVDAAGRLTFVHAPDVEQPFIDDDITRLPISMQKQISLLVKIIVGTQAPPLVKASLEMIVDEINTHGSMAHVPDMARGFSMLKAEEARGRAEGNTWVEGGMEVGLRDLYGMFDRFRQNFPLVMARDLDVQQSSIDPQVFDSAKFKQGHSEYLKAVKGVEQSGLASEEFVRLSQTRETQRKNIGSLAQYVPSKEDRFVVDGTEKSVDELKKGFVFDQSGTIDGVVDRVEKMTSIADSSAAVALVSAAKAILKGIWEG